MAAFKDYYETLGVSQNATADEIKAAFRKQARLYHPDVAKDKVAGEVKFKEANEAHEVLSDPEKRKKYDQLREQGPLPGEAHQAPGFNPGQSADGSHFEGTGFSDFFEQFFGRSQGFGDAPFPDEEAAPRGKRHGHDIEGAILVTLEEVLNGSIREISFQKPDPAAGTVRTESFKVRIPKGTLEGQVIRVHGKGQTGRGGGEAGHLFLHVRLASHPDFQVLGADLYYQLLLAPWEAVLGATVGIHSLDGDIQVRIPPSTTSGQKLRVRGRGLPKPKSEERGDLYAIAEIQMPSEITPEARKLWEELSKTSSFNPRA